METQPATNPSSLPVWEPPLTVITPRRTLREGLSLTEFWGFRTLIYLLTLRDIKVRYKQAALGIAWALLQPIFTVATFSIFFGKLAKMPSDGVPYPVFSFAAMLPWTYFAGSIARGSNSLVSAGTLLSKVYFPRLIIPLTAVFSGLLDYLLTLVVLIPVLAYYGYMPTWTWAIGLPILTVVMIGLSLGVSLWLSSLNVKYRDVAYILPFFMQLWMFVTPIVYPLSLVPAQYQWLALLNPMAGVIESYRMVLLGHSMQWHAVGYALILTSAVLFSGLVFFSRTERRFADLI